MRVSDNGVSAARLMASLLLMLLWCGVVPAAVPDKSDVRVLIDISGSMRQNDPDNLRRPALRMLAGLLQPGTVAGVWTFGRWANNLVAVGEVDAAWKERTRTLSGQISSPGQFTNIEEVLDSASRDWTGTPTTHSRHLLLLTDGMVDVSKQPADNEQSRARILDTLLPRLKAAGVKVHTIALSERADHDLMQRLAAETDGWYQQVVQADELQRVFLRMFEKVGTPDSVPLQDNRFVIDGSVNEATVLLFSKPDSPPVELRSPSGETYLDSDLPAGVAWHRDQGYDMITIAAPQKGEWTLQADVDPDNRIMIVTDLKLEVSDLPTHIAVGESTALEASLTNRGERVTRQAFLRLLDVRADASGPDGARRLALNDSAEHGDEQAGDGRYGVLYGEPAAAQEVELLVAVDSPTFMREKRLRLVVHEPLVGVVEGGTEGPLLSVTMQMAVMQPDATLTAWQEDASGRRLPLQLAQTQPDQWTAALADPLAPSYAEVSGMTRAGSPVTRLIGPLMPAGVEPPPAAIETPVAEEAPPPPAATPAPQPEPRVPAAPTGEQRDWVMPAAIFGALNLILLIAVGIWLALRRRREANFPVPELEHLLEEQLPDASTNGDAWSKEDAA